MARNVKMLIYNVEVWISNPAPLFDTDRQGADGR